MQIHITGHSVDPHKPQVDIPEYIHKQATSQAVGSVKFTIATLNVLTLNDNTKQQPKAQRHLLQGQPQRAAAVYAQLHYHKVAIACLQEPRAKKSRRTQNKDY